VKRVVKAALRALAADPSAGEPLQGKLQGLMKYRVKRYRIVYQADRARRALRIFAVGHRRAVYEELADAIRRSPK
jgi:mRNA-degrading endonuclease RelE of RelBE toxin-antitoxin system